MASRFFSLCRSVLGSTWVLAVPPELYWAWSAAGVALMR